MRKIVMASFVTSIVSGTIVSAYAQEGMGTRNWKDWDVTIGLGGQYEPVSPGVDETEVAPLPYVDIEYKKRFFVKAEKGIGAYIFRNDGDPEYAMGVALGYDEGREEGDAQKQLDGLGDLEGSAEATIFFEGEVGPVEIEFDITKGLGSDGHDGLYAELSAGVDGQVTDNLFLGIAPFVTYADKNYTQSYFGITNQQAARSATYSTPFMTDGGFQNFGIEVNAMYKISQNWSVLGMAEYTQLMGDAKDSPIVDNDGFFSVGAAIAYTF